jgi:hypothetical protein
LTSSVTNAGVSGQTVSFTLDGNNVGTATTGANGVATLTTSSPISDPVGTKTGAVVASFAGSTNYVAAANATGDLVVSKAGTSLGSVSNSPAISGNTSTMLSATLTSSVTHAGVAGETVSFMLGSSTTVVGTGVTNASGVASASVSTTGLTVGETITASYSGSASYNAATNATGSIT